MSYDLKGFSILIIDDEKDILETLSEILEIVGARSHTAKNGCIGYDMVKEIQPDIILCDLAMPECDGWEFIRLLRNNDDIKIKHVIAFSAHASMEEEALEASFDYFLAKPIAPEKLIDFLMDIISQ
ncbi:MAG: response regulator [Chloroflexi bacterium]|nr:response regulator [Chloroflexota bacterium]